MKRKIFMVCSAFMLLLIGSIAAWGADIDPILINKESPIVVGCNDDYFIEIDGRAALSGSVGKFTANSDEVFLMIIVKMLFLSDDIWDDGFEQGTFSVSYDGPMGAWSGALNTMVTNDRLNQKGYDLITDSLVGPSFKQFRLIFSIPKTITDKSGWTLNFRPTQYLIGGDGYIDDWEFDVVVDTAEAEPECETAIAFTVQ